MKNRIAILEQAGVISKSVQTYVNDVIDMLNKDFSQNKNGMEMLTTHLAMATQRIINKEEIELLDASIWNEVTQNKNFENAKNLYELISKNAPVQFPESEQRFLLMHLCNLYQN